MLKKNLLEFALCNSAAASGWAGWALAHPEFGSSANPITTRGADYAHLITASPSGFENPAASLHKLQSLRIKQTVRPLMKLKSVVICDNTSYRFRLSPHLQVA